LRFPRAITQEKLTNEAAQSEKVKVHKMTMQLLKQNAKCKLLQVQVLEAVWAGPQEVADLLKQV
jgi:hypothetical protein